MSALLTPSDYPADYIEVPFTTDEQALADGAVANLQATWADWTPNDGDIEVVLIETLSPYAAAAAQNAAQMPPAAFIALGTKLYGIPYGQGIPATTTVALTFQDDAGGYYVPAASEFDLQGYAFQTVSDVTSDPGSAIVTGVDVIANDIGVAFNGLTSADWASVTMPVWVTDLTTEAATEGGVDAQDDYDYLNYVSRELQLRGRMIVTLSDYEIAAINTGEVGRAYAATVGPRDVEVWLVAPDGNPVADTVKDTLAAIYDTATLVNTTYVLSDANYEAIDVEYSVVALPGYDIAGLVASVNSVLQLQLSPSGWGTVTVGQPGSGVNQWVNDTTVRLNKVIAWIGNVPGVAYVVENSVLINGVAADFEMPGPVALPTPGTMSGTASTS